jgi:transcriptional regulator with XRE-family HTH domain
MELRERLAQLRQSRNYKLRELREAIEAATGESMALSYLSTLEKENRTPSIDTLTKIAAGYGMSLRELLGPVVLPGAPQRQYSQTFEEVAAERGMSDAEKEELYQFEFRGKRPETKEDWDLLYSVLKTIEKRGA